jgi:hypothetical protein
MKFRWARYSFCIYLFLTALLCNAVQAGLYESDDSAAQPVYETEKLLDDVDKDVPAILLLSWNPEQDVVHSAYNSFDAALLIPTQPVHVFLIRGPPAFS